MEYKHGSHSDIQLLVKNGYNYKDSININKNLIRKKTRKYIKKYQSFKWCISIYKFNKYVNTYYYYNLEELKSVFKELFYIQNKDFNKTILVYDDNILNKYGSMRIRKTKGKNNLKFYYQINNI
tara:strand:- start:1228 stop:1599 length:372 start_codon:yes stop_codon:yes gene_type:complete